MQISSDDNMPPAWCGNGAGIKTWRAHHIIRHLPLFLSSYRTDGSPCHCHWPDTIYHYHNVKHLQPLIYNSLATLLIYWISGHIGQVGQVYCHNKGRSKKLLCSCSARASSCCPRDGASCLLSAHCCILRQMASHCCPISCAIRPPIGQQDWGGITGYFIPVTLGMKLVVKVHRYQKLKIPTTK